METTEICKNNNLSKSQKGWDGDVDADEEVQELVQTLPKERNWPGSDLLYFYQGFWCPSISLNPFISFQKNFQPLENDIFLVSVPKCGTTWMKALIFTIVNRNQFELQNSPLLTLHPQEAVPFLELNVYLRSKQPKLENMCRPRIFATHSPYSALPRSIKQCPTAKIVYICRNPMDMFVSLWHFANKIRSEHEGPLLPLNEAFDMFCRGIHGFGPFSDHVLSYWKAKQENPDKILFLKYEDVKEDTISYVKELASFVGFPFSEEEEKRGVVEEIAKFCSIDNMKAMEVNKSGNRPSGIPNNAFFRKGEVGDWSNYLTPSMAEHLKKHIMQGKLDNCGLTFKFSSNTSKDVQSG